ncbi:MAG: hypothetical protein NE334_06000 [Lentisphaeraceae bacterium]|nr:hypothetical protein [Lentisphaeraceae bacterium]
MKKVCLVFLLLLCSLSAENLKWLSYEGKSGPGVGKHIVLISGDEEYRSEEALPMMAKILAEHHGFKCTVLFAIDPKTGFINPYINDNIPGLKFLEDADLMFIATRWRMLPDNQMKYFDDYLLSGKPVVGIRTSNHAFRNKKGSYLHYSQDYKNLAPDIDPKDPWFRGFGGLLFGDYYHKHHGKHKVESTRGKIAPGAEKHPVLNGIKDGEIWGATDVYGCRVTHLPITPLVLGQVLKRQGPFQKNVKDFGMKPTDVPVQNEKNSPMIPVSWLKKYKHPKSSKEGIAFHTSMGSSTDLENAALRRLVVNGVYHTLGLTVPTEGAKVDYVGEYKTTQFGFWGKKFWDDLKLKVEDLK